MVSTLAGRWIGIAAQSSDQGTGDPAESVAGNAESAAGNAESAAGNAGADVAVRNRSDCSDQTVSSTAYGSRAQ
jgi:hypothetical protein